MAQKDIYDKDPFSFDNEDETSEDKPITLDDQDETSADKTTILRSCGRMQTLQRSYSRWS